MSNISSKSSNISINGTFVKEFQPVKEMFYKNLATGDEDNAQLCIYVGEDCVVDLYGSANDNQDYGPDMFHVSKI